MMFNDVQISSAMTNNIQLSPMMFNQIKCRPYKVNYHQCTWLDGASHVCATPVCRQAGSNGLQDTTLRFKNIDMGRPPVDDQNKRVVQVNIRLTEDEYKKASEHAEASRLSPANWMRYKVFTGKFPPMKASPLNAKIFYELNKMGVNLNQITHKINQGDIPKDYLLHILQVQALLTKILKLLSNDGKPD